jgi:hypothetical protein
MLPQVQEVGYSVETSAYATHKIRDNKVPGQPVSARASTTCHATPSPLRMIGLRAGVSERVSTHEHAFYFSGLFSVLSAIHLPNSFSTLFLSAASGFSRTPEAFDTKSWYFSRSDIIALYLSLFNISRKSA